MSETKLLSCPFCGGEASVVCKSEAVYIACNKCNAIMGRTRKSASALRGKLSFDTKEEAIKAWNNRKPMDDIVERLEKEKNDFIQTMADGDYLRGNVNFSVVAIEIVKEVINK